jgi:tRNA A-37 threonylcarbamoyl transferase component Bud32
VSLLRRLDAACLRFEDEWQAGRRPDLGAALEGFAEQERALLLAELLPLDWSYRRQAGESFYPEEYGRRFPDCRAAVEQAWQCWSQGRTGPLSTAAGALGPTTEPPAQVHLPGYEKLELLGRGGMGEVYKAFDPQLKRWVALKRVRLDRVQPDRLERFRREAELLARLAHPHIVPVYGFVESDGQQILEMEYVPGGTLDQHVGDGRLAPADAARLLAILAWAVHAAHAKGIVHRDLKPANVLLGPAVPGNPGNILGGFPKISDFGLAALTEAPGDQTLSGALMGTPTYMSPEQAAGKRHEVGPPADVWALGVVLYRCLAGVLPFKGDSVLETLERVKTLQMRPPREVCPEVPAELEAVCLACLRKDPAERPTAAELATRLERLVVGEEKAPARSRSAAPPVSVGDAVPLGLVAETAARPRPAPRRRRRWAIGAGLTAASLLAAGVWFLNHKQPPGGGAGPLTINLRVQHYEHTKEGDFLTKEIGKEFLEVHYDDRVVIRAELSGPAQCFLMGCNFDGKEQLLWPCDERGQGDPGRPPPAVGHFRYPPLPPPGPDGKPGKETGLALADDKAGGMQAFLVVASRQPLRAYGEWAGKRGAIPWQRLPPVPGVWRSNGATLDTMKLGGLRVRGHVVELEGQPPLLQLCSWAKGSDVDVVVEALAFPVYRREGK